MAGPNLPSDSAHRRLVLIPSYNSGGRLLETVRAASEFWPMVWVIIDGSTDGSGDRLAALQPSLPGLRVLTLPENRGKGGAVLEGLRRAREAGFEFALVMDADGQHPAERIPQLMALSMQHPDAMILGVPEFAPDAPANRKHGRRVGNWWADLETFWGGVEDSLFGFRVYPIRPSLQVLEHIRGGRRYDFDTELVVRLYWRGVRPLNVPVPVKYFTASEGGVSHFHYVRDNLLLVKAHTFLVLGMLARWRSVWRLRKPQGVPTPPPPTRSRWLFIVLCSLSALPFLALVTVPQRWPLWLVCHFFFQAFLLYGNLSPNCGWFGPVFSSFETERREVWLTIDDGPDPRSTPQVLALLKRFGVRATFFVVGDRVRAHPELARAVLAGGHTLGNHSATHPAGLFWLLAGGPAAREIDGGTGAIAAATGTTPRWFRAPVGMANYFIRAGLQQRRIPLAGWSARGFDGVRSKPERVVARVFRHVRPGAVLLLHERPDPSSLAALEAVLARLQAEGFACVIPGNSTVEQKPGNDAAQRSQGEQGQHHFENEFPHLEAGPQRQDAGASQRGDSQGRQVGRP